MWENADFNKWGEVLKGVDKAKRREAMAAMLQIFEYDDPPGTYIHALPMFYGIRKGIQWEPTGKDFMDLRAGNLAFEN